MEIDLLAPATGRTGRSHRHEQVEGVPLARRTVGAELVREAYVERDFSGRLPDGRPNRVRLRVASVAVVVVLKALAMADRDKPKDAYDLDYLLAHTAGGPDAVADEFAALPSGDPVTRALAVLGEKFESIDAYGPTSVATYRGLPLGQAEADAIQAAAFARVQRLLDTLSERG